MLQPSSSPVAGRDSATPSNRAFQFRLMPLENSHQLVVFDVAQTVADVRFSQENQDVP